MKYIYLKPLLALLLLVGSHSLHAQTLTTDSAKAAAKTDSLKKIRAEDIYVEVGGAGWLFTLNYDTRFNKRRDGLGFRIGTGYFQHTQVRTFFAPGEVPYTPAAQKYFMLPLQINYLLGKKNHFAEFGAGATYTMYNGGGRSSNDLFPYAKPGNQFKLVNTLTVGYRYQPLKGGISVRVNADVLYSAIFFVPTAGLSVGYTFKAKKTKVKKTANEKTK